MYSGDGNVWLRWLDTNTTVTSRLDTPKTLPQVSSPTADLLIASADRNQLTGRRLPLVFRLRRRSRNHLTGRRLPLVFRLRRRTRNQLTGRRLPLVF